MKLSASVVRYYGLVSLKHDLGIIYLLILLDFIHFMRNIYINQGSLCEEMTNKLKLFPVKYFHKIPQNKREEISVKRKL